MTDEQMLKEIVDRRIWGTTRVSDFDWLMNHIEYQRKEIEYLREANSINAYVNNSMNEKIREYENVLKTFGITHFKNL